MIQYTASRQFQEKEDGSYEPNVLHNAFNDCKFNDPLALQIETELCLAVGYALDVVDMATDSEYSYTTAMCNGGC